MLEILFIFGVIGWLAGMAWEFLSGLAAFPTILTAFAGVPLVAYADYLALVQRLEMTGLGQERLPVPPERFYWDLHRERLRRVFLWNGLASVVGWGLAVTYPASLIWDGTSFMGWIAGAAAIFTTARAVAHGVFYVRAAHWFDHMAPWAVGFCRRAMYRISQNPDFLEADPSEHRKQEKTIY